ncbi:MAG: FtsX-like permease family protein [Candidatus Dormibacteraeota bacterium]|nr:FtsX-like permease family protein [Candidatus Dormibacteraeota bacterium]
MGILALLRRLRTEVPLVAGVAAVVLVTSLLFAAMPRVFNAMSEAGLRSAVSAAAVDQRGIVATNAGRLEPGPGGGINDVVDAHGSAFQGKFPASIRAVIGHRGFVVDSVRYIFPAATYLHLSLRYQDGLEHQVKVVAGRLPQPAAGALEVAMSRETAQALNLALGQTVVLGPDPTDRLIRPSGGPPPEQAFRVVGLIEPIHPNADYWFGDGRLQTPSVSNDPNMPAVYGTAMFAARAYPDVLRATAPALLQYSWRYFVEPGRFQANQADQLAADLQKVEARYSAFSSSVTDTGVISGLPDVLAGFFRQRDLSETLLSLLALGLLAISLAVIGLLAALVADRRREEVALVRARGASPTQLVLAQVLEGALLSLPVAVAGYLLAVALVRSEPSDWSLSVALGIAVLTTVLLLGTALPWVRRNLGSFQREDVGSRRFSPRRAALDAFVVVLAGAGVYLLRQRGLDAAGGATGGFDPYLSAAPMLLGLATGLVVIRLYVFPLRLLAWRTYWRREPVLFLGLSRASRLPRLTTVPLLTLLVAIALAVFASVMVTTIQVGQVRSAWQQVGADYRIDPANGTNGGLDPALDFSRTRGVVASASAYRQNVGGVSVFAVQPAAYQRVTAGTPIDPHLTGALLTPRSNKALGTGGNPIPALVSRQPPRAGAQQPGDFFQLQVSDQTLTLVVKEVRDSFAGLPAGHPFVVMSLAALQAAEPDDPPVRTQLYLRAPAGAQDAIQTALQKQYGTGAVLSSRAQDYSQVHDSPLVSGAVGAFQAGVAVAGVYSALAVVVALALGGRARGRDLGYLRTLGLSRRQVAGLIAVEQVPPAVVALLVGVGLGVAITWLIAPGVDFSPFTGPGAATGPQVDWMVVSAVALGLLVVVGAAVAAAGLLARRMNLGAVMRLEER